MQQRILYFLGTPYTTCCLHTYLWIHCAPIEKNKLTSQGDCHFKICVQKQCVLFSKLHQCFTLIVVSFSGCKNCIRLYIYLPLLNQYLKEK
ncbi:hypothetical protein XELAEV_18009142mg [Xenopus laevis]|uniref:Uncharacterized protein n=1 Tax=Xenopus laevis TaxID=8355 RepID=A0A974DRV1_XENLA|nr:hypothetical protein XELAEV_18009142mg [Xenopus laevis]